MMNKTAVCLVAWFTLFASWLRAAELREQTWVIDGVTRQALVAKPDGKPERGLAPVVLVFHGHGGSSQNAARMFRLHQAWPEACVVYPQGLPTPTPLVDKDGVMPGWQIRGGTQGDRDLAFYDAMLASLRREPGLDARRVFVAGHSNGGAFAYLLWAERGDTLRALAPSAAALTISEAKLRPLPVLHMGGIEDRLVKFEWQERMIDLVLRVNHGGERRPSAAGETVYPPKDGAGAETVLFLHAGGHRLPADVGERVAEFFKRQPR